ncbi:collagen-like protein [Tenacibaculum finnmarkense]|uniref:collagen-like protein n=1 Tax=Tenacibaculum finnmarkense TaxID=2781243 RepID=UPI001EFAE62E|nr:collagen-like protein [Tenacibaculum finnmarkense]MCG8239608.1 collagen-like protein [Tenacibaculum finnmarkense genomovar ulcerans]
MSRKVETTHLQVKSVKNAKVLGTDKDGFVIESDLDFLNYIPKDGAKGEKGEKGDTGAKGADGLKGVKGDTGERGYPGVNGHGYPGKDGAMGFPGPKGPKGDTGAKGADGLKGEKGDTGAKGADGLKGEKGDTGAKGADGLKGIKGDIGAKGSDANSIDVQGGTNITIDKTNPLKPVINSSLPAKFYEEGVFEPILSSSYDASDLKKRYKTVSPKGYFIRIGNSVSFSVVLNNISDPEDGVYGALCMHGIPFSTANGFMNASSLSVEKMVFNRATNNTTGSEAHYKTTTPSKVRANYAGVLLTFKLADGFPLQDVVFNDNTSGNDLYLGGTFITDIYKHK